jgi:hypothetical protein
LADVVWEGQAVLGHVGSDSVCANAAVCQEFLQQIRRNRQPVVEWYLTGSQSFELVVMDPPGYCKQSSGQVLCSLLHHTPGPVSMQHRDIRCEWCG